MRMYTFWPRIASILIMKMFLFFILNENFALILFSIFWWNTKRGKMKMESGGTKVKNHPKYLGIILSSDVH